MRVISVFFLSIFSLTLWSQQETSFADIESVPVASAVDQQFNNVFKMLDGEWRGTFDIYQDTQLKRKGSIELHDISLQSITERGLKKVNSIDVQQIYTSETPLFQRVVITDYYPNSGKTEVSHGVNKVQNGQIWCVVKKPNDTVIHSGELLDKKTITWQRSESNPQRVEYFKETVSAGTYEIVGWGYYEGDDIEMNPKLWFYAKYKSVD